MTSGSFHSIPLSEITVTRESRQRKLLAGVPDVKKTAQKDER